MAGLRSVGLALGRRLDPAETAVEITKLVLGRRSALVTAASSDRAQGRRTWAGNRERWLRGAVRSARVRCCRSDTARTRRHARTATRWHTRARCRPRPPTREQTCWGWPPIGQLPLLSRTSRPPHGVGVPGTPGSASHYRRRTRPRRPRHRLQRGAGRRGELDRGWLHPESRHRRPSRRGGRHLRPRQAHLAARAGRACSASWASTSSARVRQCEGRRWVRRPSGTRTPPTGSRGLRRSP